MMVAVVQDDMLMDKVGSRGDGNEVDHDEGCSEES